MVDLKQQGQNKIAPCCHFDESIEVNEFEQKTKSYFNRLMSGERIQQCKHCWKAEDAGLQSVRTGSVNWLPHDGGEGIKRMDIRIHNKCNLACTMCYSGASNLWGKLEGRDTFRMLTEDEIEFIRDKASSITHISFQGGEPFYGPEYDDFLMSLENLENISVDIFTNVISVKRDVIQRWKDKLKDLVINASVDGHADIYDSIRWPTTWGKFERNAKMIYDIVGRNLTYYWTLQAENSHNLFDFIKWRDEVTPYSKIQVNMVMGSPELGVNSITDEEKELFLQKFQMYKETASQKNDTSEYNQIYAINTIIEQVDTNHNLIRKRFKRLNEIYKMRKMYS